MSLLYRRYLRSAGYPPLWFFGLAACGFAGLAIWALVHGDWLVAALALAMVAVALAFGVASRRLARALAASQAEQLEHTAERRLT